MAVELLNNLNGILTASGAVAQYRFVKRTTTAMKMALAGVGDLIDGVEQNGAADGDTLALSLSGSCNTTKITAGAAITAGDPLTADATGRAIPATGADADNIGGFAIEAATAAGQIITMLQVNPARNPAGFRVARGQSTTVAAVDTIVTGLGALTAVVASLDSDPVDDPFMVSASIGDQSAAPLAGSFYLKSWKNTGGTDPTPGAATTFGKKVNWIAWGA